MMGGASDRGVMRASGTGLFSRGACCGCGCGGLASIVDVLSWTVFRSSSGFVALAFGCSESKSSISSGFRPFDSRKATLRSWVAFLMVSSSRKRRACSNGSRSGTGVGLFVSGPEGGDCASLLEDCCCQCGIDGGFFSEPSPAMPLSLP